MNLFTYVRDVPDFPKPGITFRDITPLLAHPHGLRHIVGTMVDHLGGQFPLVVDMIVALDARGFIIGGALAHHLQLPLVLVRKKGKLPFKTVGTSYGLEYGSDEIEMHADAIIKGDRALIVDDLLATGGTARAACDLVEKLGGVVAGCFFLIELDGLGGRSKLGKYEVYSILTYEQEKML
ncbi:adenine phosphoribosyltransferase [Candidatus Kaiserbacteria bacterium RIFCSPHIGHO2_01_FULL_56_24]|uniref:Adenine phosphoribosyltransferase n=1 Tax=Candidatus Kaiserbacteria bacterium RIFCSPHIGHO2_01_FULL_56_24 TaxID=1798487 RepID=A0A1F6DH45_9BACT|nr:MAG: adenine phosphoribosyltransferase [Candidatus Kaiserbacteria bacterium RIFCSPHIGHO2_01_FULL_56_24]